MKGFLFFVFHIRIILSISLCETGSADATEEAWQYKEDQMLFLPFRQADTDLLPDLYL
jgi:hypothetical protein